MWVLAFLAGGYLVILLAALITGKVEASGGGLLRTQSPEGYWVMIGTYGLAALSSLVAAVTA